MIDTSFHKQNERYLVNCPLCQRYKIGGPYVSVSYANETRDEHNLETGHAAQVQAFVRGGGE